MRRLNTKGINFIRNTIKDNLNDLYKEFYKDHDFQRLVNEHTSIINEELKFVNSIPKIILPSSSTKSRARVSIPISIDDHVNNI